MMGRSPTPEAISFIIKPKQSVVISSSRQAKSSLCSQKATIDGIPSKGGKTNTAVPKTSVHILFINNNQVCSIISSRYGRDARHSGNAKFEVIALLILASAISGIIGFTRFVAYGKYVQRL
jgi:hypothetical protein